MGRKLHQIDDGWFYEFFINPAAVATFDDVALGHFKKFEEARGCTITKEILGQLDGTPGVLDDLNSLYPRDFVKEPSAARVHEHCMELEFQEE